MLWYTCVYSVYLCTLQRPRDIWGGAAVGGKLPKRGKGVIPLRREVYVEWRRWPTILISCSNAFFFTFPIIRVLGLNTSILYRVNKNACMLTHCMYSIYFYTSPSCTSARTLFSYYKLVLSWFEITLIRTYVLYLIN